MSVLVTGGSGLIGSHVVESLLERGERPVIYDLKVPPSRLNVPFVQGSITERDLVLEACKVYDVDRIIHMAALLQFECEQRPYEAVQVNVLGTLNLLEAAKVIRARRFVYASSGALYGPVEGDITEATPICQGVGLYGATKYVCEVMGFRYNKVFGVPFVALRYWGVYGPGEVASPGIAEVLKRIESTVTGKDVIVREAGAEEKHHFTFVRDVAQATLLALDARFDEPKVYNIAGGEDSFVSFREFHETIRRLCPSAGKVTFQGRGQNRGRVDITRARRELGYEPRYTLEMGIREVIDYWQSQRSV
jgi:nucleoside-diphosphate-sugar epimerase